MWLKGYLDMSQGRPKWTVLADAILAKAVAAGSQRVDPEARINTFLQTWEVSARATANMPGDLETMVRAAKKYNVRVEAVRPTEALKREMPIWYHIGVVSDRVVENSPARRCLRLKHKVITVADCERVAKRLAAGSEHVARNGCECRDCHHDRTELGCDAPHRCAKSARTAVNKLNEKWKPCRRPLNDGLSLTPSRRQANTMVIDGEGEKTFNPTITQATPVGLAFRIFCEDSMGRTATVKRPPRPYAIERETTTVYTDGSCEDNGLASARAGAGIWFGEEDTRNEAARVVGGVQSNQTGEILAAAMAVDRVPPFVPLTIVTD
ncbi:hypothetical protein C2E23DRAFT_706998, partial [Lenzites betulinus]